MFLLHLFHYIGFFGAQINNSILSFLILKRAPKLLGAYRHVMLTFTICSMWFSWVEIVTQPVVHHKGPMFVVFLEERGFSERVGHFIACLHCGTFGFITSVLTAQFFYRYLVLCKPQTLRFLTGFRLFSIFLPSLFIYIFWFSVVDWGMSATPEKREYLRGELKLIFNIDSMSVAFIASWYWEISDSQRIWRFKDVLSAGICVLIIGTLCSLILFFAINIFFHMKNASSQMSQKTVDLNKQLFVMLCVQTLFPFFTMYIPVGLLIGLPLLNLSMNPYTNYASASIAIYPMIEPLIAMYCISDFRKTIANFMRGWKRGPRVATVRTYIITGNQLATSTGSAVPN